jgi:hypothetical protein
VIGLGNKSKEKEVLTGFGHKFNRCHFGIGGMALRRGTEGVETIYCIVKETRYWTLSSYHWVSRCLTFLPITRGAAMVSNHLVRSS